MPNVVYWLCWSTSQREKNKRRRRRRRTRPFSSVLWILFQRVHCMGIFMRQSKSDRRDASFLHFIGEPSFELGTTCMHFGIILFCLKENYFHLERRTHVLLVNEGPEHFPDSSRKNPSHSLTHSGLGRRWCLPKQVGGFWLPRLRNQNFFFPLCSSVFCYWRRAEVVTRPTILGCITQCTHQHDTMRYGLILGVWQSKTKTRTRTTPTRGKRRRRRRKRRTWLGKQAENLNGSWLVGVRLTEHARFWNGVLRQGH